MTTSLPFSLALPAVDPRAVIRAVRGRPSILGAVTALAVCLPPGPQDQSAAVHVTVADLASVAFVAAAAISLVAGGRRLPRRIWLLAPMAGLTALATCASPDLVTSLPGFIRFMQVFVLIPLAVAAAVKDRFDAWLLAGSVVAVAVVQGVAGCWQSLTETGASYAGEHVRAVGTFGAQDVMGMAAVVSYGVIILFGLGLAVRGGRGVAALAGAAALCVPLVLSLSRGTWLAMLVAAVVMLMLYGLRTAIHAGLLATAAAVVLVAGLGVGSGLIEQRMTSITSSFSQPDQSVNDRYSLWQTAAGMWTDHPATGVGPRMFAVYRDGYAPLRLSSGSDTDDLVNGFQRQPLLSPHNMYLLLLSEQGLVGLTGFVVFAAVTAVWTLLRLRRTERRGLNRAAGLSAAGFLVWQLVDFAYSDIGGSPTLVMSLMLGITFCWAASARSDLRGRAR